MKVLQTLFVHELERLARSRRLWLVTALFLGAAFLIGAVGILAIHAIETAIVEELAGTPGATTPDGQLSPEVRDQVFAEIRGELDERWQRAGALSRSVLGTSTFVLSLLALPFLVAIGFSDSLSRDRRNRSWRFDTLRASRTELLGVRLAACVAVVVALVAIACGAVLLAGALVIETQRFGDAVAALLAIVVRSAPVVFVVMAWVLAASASTRSATTALIRAVMILAFWTLGVEIVAALVAHLAELDVEPLVIRTIHALQPARHASALASSSSGAAALGALALLLHGGAGVGVTYRILSRSDA